MKAFVTWPILLVVVALDVMTKAAAEATLTNGIKRQVIGDLVRFTLVYNPGAAFGLYLGGYSRWIFMGLTVAALAILARLYQQTERSDLLRAGAIALVAAGAIGNLIDRVRQPLGVVDFIDVGFGTHRWPTFNIADVAVSSGAFLLAFVLWGEEQRMEGAAAATAAATATGPAAADATERT